MTPELTALILAALLQVVQFTIYAVLANLQVGTKTAMGPRDTKIDLTGTAGRAQRAMNNHFEGLILFAIATLTLTYADKGNALTAAASITYLIARALYVPAYLFGLVPWRSIVWAIGFAATIVLLIQALI